MACKAAGINEAQRRDVILRNIANAEHDGDITSTSPRLTDADFEKFMAIVEQHAGGTILSFSPGHWQAHATDRYSRMRYRVERIAQAIRDAGLFHAQSLEGWIKARVTKGLPAELSALDFNQLQALLLQLQAFAKQRGIALDD